MSLAVDQAESIRLESQQPWPFAWPRTCCACSPSVYGGPEDGAPLWHATLDGYVPQEQRWVWRPIVRRRLEHGLMPRQLARRAMFG